MFNKKKKNAQSDTPSAIEQYIQSLYDLEKIDKETWPHHIPSIAQKWWKTINSKEWEILEQDQKQMNRNKVGKVFTNFAKYSWETQQWDNVVQAADIVCTADEYTEELQSYWLTCIDIYLKKNETDKAYKACKKLILRFIGSITGDALEKLPYIADQYHQKGEKKKTFSVFQEQYHYADRAVYNYNSDQVQRAERIRQNAILNMHAIDDEKLRKNDKELSFEINSFILANTTVSNHKYNSEARRRIAQLMADPTP